MGAEPNLRALKPAPFKGLRFGPFELDLGSAELWKAGARVKLQLQPFRVLALLAGQPGRLLTREEIQKEVWADGTFVDFEQALNFCIRQIRAALGDQASTPRYIETLPRRGYRFIGEVETIEPPAAEPALEAPATLPPPTDPRPTDPAVPIVRLFPRPQPASARPWIEGASRRLAPWLAGIAIGVGGAALVKRATPLQAPAFHRITFLRGFVQSARFGNGGDVLYSASWEGRKPAVFAVRTENLEARPIPAAGTRLVGVSPTGEVAFIGGDRGQSSVLTRVPLGGGAPKEVLDGVRAADWDGEDFAIARGENSRRSIEYPIGTLLCEALRPTGVRLSPSRDRVAFLEHPMHGDDRGDVVVVDRKGHRTTLSSGWASAEGLAWSPDGREVWFTAARSGADNELQAVTLDGKVRTIVPALGRLILHDIAPDGRVLLQRTTMRHETYFRRLDQEGERDLSWLDLSKLSQLTPDGKQILFVESGEGGGPEYASYLRKTDGSVPVRIGTGNPTALSPNGAWVLAIPVLSRDRLQLVPTGAGEVRVLQDPQIAEYEWAAFLPNGRDIVFAAREKDREVRMYLRSLGGGPPRPFTPPGVAVWDHTVSPDGLSLAAPCGSEWCLYPIAGGDAKAIPGTKGRNVIGWGDADTLYVRERARVPAIVSRLTLSTGTVEPWREIAPPDLSGVANISSVAVTADGSAYAYSFARLLSDLYVVTGLK
jgi:DNA-binding winged helix-turn-helix (wHTH) protein/dipeptidyl aminopeptidase/acylaminoacyl peptidase